jgi:diguanylate cyclase (GGDEF)-like protein
VTKGPTIGVLSTSFGGPYFGGVMGGIARAVAAAHGRIVAIQTLDAGTFAVDLAVPPDFGQRVAWDHVDGFVVILNAVEGDYLAEVTASGRPIVMISDNLSGFPGPLVLPDNRSGITEAVTHLVEHGHRRIGFAGYPVQKDISERYEAYQDTLRGHGISPDPDLFFNTGNNQESGGVLAAQAMLTAGMPCTAVVTGNDLNAIGLVETLTAAGLDLPGDQAVIGFDDTEAAAFLVPTLSSVRQPLARIGGDAVDLLLRQLAGETVTPGSYSVRTSLVARESCGCTQSMSLVPAPRSAPRDVEPGASPEPGIPSGAASGTGQPPEAPAVAARGPEDGPTCSGDLLDLLVRVLTPEFRVVDPARHREVLGGCVDILADVVRAAIEAVPGPSTTHLRRALGPLEELLIHPERLVETLRYVRCFARRQVELAGAADRGETIRRVEDCLLEIGLVLAQAQTRALFRRSSDFFDTLSTQYSVSKDLLRSHRRDPRSLSWLQQAGVREGCLGLWSTRTSGGVTHTALDLVGTFDRDRAEWYRAAQPVDVRAFPPTEVIELADLSQDQMVYVAPLKLETGDWGMLAVVGPIEADLRTGRETMNQWASLLAVALEHEAVVESLREQEERLRHAALYDELTGLPNRAFFNERLRQAIRRTARRSDYQYAVLLLDLDGFKLVNDSLGHLAGDRLLVQVAERITTDLRSIDTAARFGGDEFAILLEEIRDPDSAVTIAERLQSSLRAPFEVGDQEVVLGASIGIALSTLGYQRTEHVIRDADVAMYWAKSNGKGTHAFFNSSMHTRAVDRLRIEGELRRALEEDELRVHYQPIVSLEKDEVAVVEALVRWQHPVSGLLPPGEFLPVAEESGLMLPLGAWVMAQSCRQMQDWKACLGRPVKVSINISNRQFWHCNIGEKIQECLTRGGLSPEDLILEITESVIMHDAQLARRTLNQLHDLGLKLHIDDFGTGYSSLEALHQLPIDALKVDRSFVSRYGVDARSRELLRTIIVMGHNLGLDVIAEGVETVDQLEHLKELGCAYVQGYLLSRPVPAEDLRDFLTAPDPVGRHLSMPYPAGLG